MQKNYKNRWYVKYSALGECIKKLRDLKEEERNKIILGMLDLVMNYDNELIDTYDERFPITYRRRWYDEDPYSCMVINALLYADEDLITDIILYLEEKL